MRIEKNIRYKRGHQSQSLILDFRDEIEDETEKQQNRNEPKDGKIQSRTGIWGESITEATAVPSPQDWIHCRRNLEPNLVASL